MSDGVKNDAGKRKWTLLPWRELGDVVDVLMHGAKVYPEPDNWKRVAPERYKDALLRHVLAYIQGERLDPETGKSHLAHAICCALFMMWNDNEEPISAQEAIDRAYRRAIAP